MSPLDERTVPLPRGTAVVLRTGLRAEDGTSVAAGSAARVDVGHHQVYEVVLPDGRRVVAARDTLAIQSEDEAARLVGAALEGAALADAVVFRAVVGSVAWGLDDEGSDVDRRSVFLLPFDAHVALRRPPDAVDPPGGDPLWEVEKHLQLLLKSDANALELLWSPIVEVCEPCYEPVVARRAEFVTTAVLGSFGRYAQSQFAKIERKLRQAELADRAAEQLRAGRPLDLAAEDRKALLRALHARGTIAARTDAALADAVAALGGGAGRELLGAAWRPKNAYNLLRLLHSGARLLRGGEPMIRVDEALRPRLLAVKRAEVPVEEVLAESRELGRALEEAAQASTLPDRPPLALAESLLRDLRRHAARRAFAVPAPARVVQRPDEALPAELLERIAADPDVFQLGLVGAHAYGFPSPDSDLDIKGIHLASPDALLGLHAPPQTIAWTRDVAGVEVDWTTHELAFAIRHLLAGDGTALERLAGPLQLIASDEVDELRRLTMASVGTHFARHYRGFLRSRLTLVRSPEATTKHLLYAYRVALSGEHLLRSGELVLDVRPLAEAAGLDGEVAPLIAHKASSREKVGLPALDDLEARCARLEARLASALEACTLPDAPPPEVADALARWLVEVRRRRL